MQCPMAGVDLVGEMTHGPWAGADLWRIELRGRRHGQDSAHAARPGHGLPRDRACAAAADEVGALATCRRSLRRDGICRMTVPGSMPIPTWKCHEVHSFTASQFHRKVGGGGGVPSWCGRAESRAFPLPLDLLRYASAVLHLCLPRPQFIVRRWKVILCKASAHPVVERKTPVGAAVSGCTNAEAAANKRQEAGLAAR